MKTSTWNRSNADMFRANRAFFGEQTEQQRIKAVNSRKSSSYANNVVGYIKTRAVKFGVVEPDTSFGDVLDMLNNSEL